jgi:hypothetical protein
LCLMCTFLMPGKSLPGLDSGHWTATYQDHSFKLYCLIGEQMIQVRNNSNS